MRDRREKSARTRGKRAGTGNNSRIAKGNGAGDAKPTGWLSSQLLQFFNQDPDRSYSVSQIVKQFSLKDKKSKVQLDETLQKLVFTEKISREGNNYKSNSEPDYATGTIDFVNARYAFLASPEHPQDIWIDSNRLKGALDGDTVKAVVFEGARGKRPEGEVVEILQRRKEEFVGKIEILARYAFVVPDSKKMHQDIYVKKEHINGATEGDKVQVRITQWPDGEERKPEGEVIQVLGKAGEHQTEMHAIMAEYGLPFGFPDAVEKEAKRISTTITAEEIAKRRDFRQVTTFTIDPEDAKDFDDALSFRLLENGNWEVGVHIADVTHYVKPNTALEREALSRATSVYLVDRVIPMLPEKLSNELCSLRPNEDKLTFSAVFELDSKAKIHNQWFGRTVIHSVRRFSYEQAQQVLDTETGDFAAELTLLNDWAKKLRQERMKKGAISFETTEVKFKLDENGVPLGIFPKVRQDAHKLIEEFMLLANKKVAEYVYGLRKTKNKLTMVYRVHERPDPEKIKTLSVFVKRFGHTLDIDEEHISQSLNDFIGSIEGKPEENVLQALAIRTMAKARYSTDAIGHFGLAFPHYSHFTSPIRRYPDMMAHRLLQQYLDQGESANREEYEEKCDHSSERERVAAEAERSSIKYKQVEFMQSKGDVAFEGIVTGVTDFGVFVEIIETRCEGMVRLSEIGDDFYELDEKNYRIVGRHSGNIINFGDKVQVRVKATNLERRSIDLEFVKEAKTSTPQTPTKSKKPKNFEDEYGFEL